MKLKSRSWRVKLEKILLPLLLVAVVITLSQSKLLSGWDNEFYDSQLRLWPHSIPSDIVIVSVDERSLAELGRWPWPRRTHAQLIDQLTQANPKVIGMAILFTEPDQKDFLGDTSLARSMKESGRVVLPLIYGQSGTYGATELLPIPMLIDAAAGIGHVSFPLEEDGLVRGQHLHAGVGDTFWPAFALEVLRLAEPEHRLFRHKQAGNFSTGNPYAWQENQWSLIPFVGAPGTVKHISYVDVLSGQVPPDFFTNKIVLVGATAPGLGDSLATPASASSQLMSGVELNANVLHALRQGEVLQPLYPSISAGLSAVFVLLAVISYYFLSPRKAIAAGAGIFLLVAGTSILLLQGFHVWFPPSSAFLILIISYPIWSWRRLEMTTHELFQTQKRATVTLNAIADAVITTDAQSRIEYLNPVAETLTGFSSDEAIGKSFHQIFRVIKDDNHAATTFPIERCITNNERISLHDSKLLLGNNDQTYNIHATAAPIKNHINSITGIAVAFSDISELRLMTEKMRHQATHDALTQLPNRVLLRDRLQHAIERGTREKQQLAILFLDLDDFKKVNDSLGHTAGDSLLTRVVERINASSRKQDTIARLGGDEFVILLEDIAHEDIAAHVASKTLNALERPFNISGSEFIVSGSIGISLFPKNGNDPETLLKHADTAMYRAKDNGRNNYQFYTEEMNAQIMKRMNMEQDLRHALENNELALHYQLQVSSHDKRIVGLECLLRWHRDDDSFISPSDFIPLAEETGLIIPIGKWVIQNVCEHAKKWQQQGVTIPRISINLSPRQFMQSQLTSYVDKMLAQTQLNPEFLGIEITESTIMQDIPSAIETLKVFRKMGVHLSIDDFGTGYSSLSYLKQFPVDQLKIDQSFVHNILSEPDDAAISEAIIAMAHSMNLNVIAEGVESQAQADFLTARGCDEMQGFHFSHPLSYRDMTSLLQSS